MPFPTKILGQELVAEGTFAVRLEKPPGFSFRAGQTIYLFAPTLPEGDPAGNNREFSLASAPHEEHLLVASRFRKTIFKAFLTDSPEGTSLSLDGPFGSFTLHQNPDRQAVFIAGGIGITPFRAMLRDAAYRKLGHRITLFYSNHRPRDAAFLGELAELARDMPNFSLVPTMTALEHSIEPWGGERERMNAGMFARHLDPVPEPFYYVAGPPQMVMAIRTMLNNAGVSDDDIKTDEFAGY